MLKNIYIIFGDKVTNKVMKLNRFININKNIDLANINREIKYNNNDSECLVDLYLKCLDEAIKYIEKVNNYLKI